MERKTMSRHDRSEIFSAFMVAMNAEKRGNTLRAETYADELVSLLEFGLLERGDVVGGLYL